MHELGAGPQLIRRAKLTAANLAIALRELVDGDPLRRQAASLGECIRAEHGADNAVREIEEESH